jgi:hypothetical protein
MLLWVSLTAPLEPFKLKLILGLVLVVLLKCSLLLFGLCSSSQGQHRIDLLGLLRAPDFPPLGDICPICMKRKGEEEEHCWQCGNCVQGWHYHGTVCVNRNNEVFWFLLEVTWTWLAFTVHRLLVDGLTASNFKLLHFSTSSFFSNAALVEWLYSRAAYIYLLLFLYVKIFLIYQCLCMFQWIYMMVLKRTYNEVNHSERYTRFFRIGKTPEGSYKSQEIRLMEHGLIPGALKGIWNAVTYFFR